MLESETCTAHNASYVFPGLSDVVLADSIRSRETGYSILIDRGKNDGCLAVGLELYFWRESGKPVIDGS